MREELLANGYRECSVNDILHPWAVCMYEKWFRGDGGEKLFAIHVLEYNWPCPSFEAKAQFVTFNDLTFNVDMLSGWKLPDMEVFFLTLWARMDCKPY